MDELKIIFDPTKEHLAQIESWLIEEDKNNKDGFYCNWHILLDYFEQERFAVVLLNEKALGFVTWSVYKKVARLQIAEIHPEYRKKGYGRIAVETLLEMLISIGVSVVDLHCQPATSEKAWKQLGFQNFPDIPDFEDENDEEGRYLYRILVPCTEISNIEESDTAIMLWDVEPYEKSRNSPKWKWEIEFDEHNKRLVKPVIAPAKRDWNICLFQHGNLVKDIKVKRFSKDEIDYGNFIVIEDLP